MGQQPTADGPAARRLLKALDNAQADLAGPVSARYDGHGTYVLGDLRFRWETVEALERAGRVVWHGARKVSLTRSGRQRARELTGRR